MNATELFHADGKSAGIYYCGKCRHVARDKDMAEQCCNPYICECGAECPKYWLICDDCRRKRDDEQEKARFEKAEKVTAWSGAVVLGDTYFRNVDELEDYLHWQSEGERPAYVWTCHEEPVCSLDYDSIIANATEEAYEDFDPQDLDGEKELTAAIEAFNEANKAHVMWTPNNKRALLLGTRAEPAERDGSTHEGGGRRVGSAEWEARGNGALTDGGEGAP